MRTFLWNLLLALSWTVSTGLFTVANLLVGLVLGYFILLFAQRVLGPSNYFAKVPLVGRFAVFYLWQLVLANLRVAYDVLTPRHYMRPGVIAVPLEARTDAEITLLANLITLTPGTLSLDLSGDRRVLYVHAMYIDHGDVDEARRRIKEGLERRVLEVLR
jgi:multicomponent Na+:H+ antiporter subunit E